MARLEDARPCTVEGCEQDRGPRKLYCNTHYSRWRLHGTPEARPRPSEAERFWSKVDRRSADECWPWTAAKRGPYGLFNVPPTTIGAHRWAYQAAYGPIPSGTVIDHKCRNKICVNPAHLQAVTSKQNNENHSGPTRASSSGVRGVFWDQTNRRWVGQVGHGGKVYSAGHHRSLDDAAEAVRALRNALWTNNPVDRGVA